MDLPESLKGIPIIILLQITNSDESFLSCPKLNQAFAIIIDEKKKKRIDRTQAGQYLILRLCTNPCVTLLKCPIITYTASLLTARTFVKLCVLSLCFEWVATAYSAGVCV